MKRKLFNNFMRLLFAVAFFMFANIYSLYSIHPSNVLACLFGVVFVLANIFPAFYMPKRTTKKITNCQSGVEMLIQFLLSAMMTTMYYGLGVFGGYGLPVLTDDINFWLVNLWMTFILYGIVLANGISRVYLNSNQLGTVRKSVGVILGMIVFIHVIVIGKIIEIALNEIKTEDEKNKLNEKRKQDKICDTKYPILLVHGAFFRDYKRMNYWGRITKELTDNGARIFYSQHTSAATCEINAMEIATKIETIIKETGSEKVNIIAHSKGGLDARLAATFPEMEGKIASITTINTPHRGCGFIDWILEKTPRWLVKFVDKVYYKIFKLLGDENPDFISALESCSVKFCEDFNERVKDVPGVFYQSTGSKINVSQSARFPLNVTFNLVAKYDGENDGLVGVNSFEWGEEFHFVTVEGRRGITHGDLIDLYKENIKGFDVREYYVQMVNDLRLRGY